MSFYFKTVNSLAGRKKMRQRLKHRYPECYPIIVQRHKSDLSTHRKKLLCHKNFSLAQVLNEIRKQVDVGASEAIYLMTEKGMPLLTANAATLSEIYEKHRDPFDEFLYLWVVKESVFGCSTGCKG